MAENETTKNSKIEGQIPSNTTFPNFGVPAFSLSEDIDVACDSLVNLAQAVLEEYNIEWSDKSGASDGGELTNLDIKRQDAMTTLNWSLMEMAAKSGKDFIEPIVNPDGEVEFREIGAYNGNIEDIYYEISTGSYTESPKAVMVTGGRPLPDMKQLSWYPIWGEKATKIYTAQNMFSNCRKQGFIRQATIVFNDPQLTSAYNDGVDNLYDINETNPWDRIVGYAKYTYPGDLATQDTVVSYTNSSSIPIKIGDINPGQDGPDMGTLVEKPKFNSDIFNPDCWTLGEDVDFTDGVLVEIDSDLRYSTRRDVFKDKFIKVSNVYLVGKKIDSMFYVPISDVDSIKTPTKENAKLEVSIEKPDTTVTRLEEGKHYAVAYEDLGSRTGKIPYIVFTKEVSKEDPFDYGKDQKFYVIPTCKYATDQDPKITENIEQIGTIFPHSQAKGILVNEIWVTVDLETPSIVIYDPGTPATDDLAGTGAKALEIAKVLEYYVAPIVISEPPAPIAYAGPSTGGRARLVDQVPKADNNPITTFNPSTTEMEQYMDEMQGGGMAITWSFLDEDSVEGMADMLYRHFQSDVVETIYTCGPDCNPILGGYGERDGVINAIRYNYTDSGSYTVSVTEGPKLTGNLTPVDGGPSMKMAENFSAGGVIIDTAGDNIHFKIRIDGYGERWAVSMTHNILRKGDVVQCTVHNNPIES